CAQQNETPAEAAKPKIDKKKLYREARKASRPRRLTFKETKELEALPGLIEELEAELEVLHNQLADPAFYRNQDQVITAKKRLADLETQHSQAFERWEHLEAIATTC
ncbi:MAG: hypothetical protein JSW27_01115, partial [Phycisphaerales bacterium]